MRTIEPIIDVLAVSLLDRSSGLMAASSVEFTEDGEAVFHNEKFWCLRDG